MFEPLTLSVSELAERWNWTPRQVLDYAIQGGVPLHFMFDGLAFDGSDEWHRDQGDSSAQHELKLLGDGIVRDNAYILRSARGENGRYEHQLSSAEITELRTKIEADEVICSELEKRLEQRETSRRKMSYRGWMRALTKTLMEVDEDGSSLSPRWAVLPGVRLSDARMMVLEPFGIYKPPITIDRLCAIVVEVKAIEAYRLATQAASEPQQTAPATDPAPLEADAMTPSPAPAQNTATHAPEATGGKKWTPEKLAELKTYREAHTMPETAVKFGISEQRIRELLPSKKPKAKPFPGLIHRMK